MTRVAFCKRCNRILFLSLAILGSCLLVVNGFVGQQQPQGRQHRKNICQLAASNDNEDKKRYGAKVRQVQDLISNPFGLPSPNGYGSSILTSTSAYSSTYIRNKNDGKQRYGAKVRQERRSRNRQIRSLRAARQDEEAEKEYGSEESVSSTKENRILKLVKWPVRKIQSKFSKEKQDLEWRNSWNNFRGTNSSVPKFTCSHWSIEILWRRNHTYTSLSSCIYE